MQKWITRLGVGLFLVAVPSTALAYDEAQSGDLSNLAATPTALTFTQGSNFVSGSVVSGTDSRDFFTFTIPAGHALTAVRQVSYTDQTGTGPGNRGFHAINAGAQGVPDPWAATSPFLGGDHLDPLPTGTDMLVELSDHDTAGIGFTVPLGPGTYTYVVQQTSIFVRYNLRFDVSGPALVPAWQTWAPAALAGVLVAVGIVMLRRRALLAGVV